MLLRSAAAETQQVSASYLSRPAGSHPPRDAYKELDGQVLASCTPCACILDYSGITSSACILQPISTPQRGCPAYFDMRQRTLLSMSLVGSGK